MVEVGGGEPRPTGIDGAVNAVGESALDHGKEPGIADVVSDFPSRCHPVGSLLPVFQRSQEEHGISRVRS
jgi:hypothetical protein